MLFYTFCVDIGKYEKNALSSTLKLLLTSLHKYLSNYKIICFTNFQLDNNFDQEYNIEFRKYYDNSIIKLYKDSWLNLSFNKINIYKDLYDEFKKDFIWIDLDTILTYDISYINDMSNVFIENGGIVTRENRLFSNNGSITIPRNRYIQGNFWKLNINLYYELIKTLEEILKEKWILRYDLQDLFSYYIYIKNHENLNNINILGNNIKVNTINGLSIWSELGNTHATINGLNNFYYDNGLLKTNFHPNKEIHIVSFTFFTLLRLRNLSKFKELFL
tara:strand:+ start:853 stop:1677 length:825 start_codon:yes stop_codon:yes gene_type:complete